MREGNAIMDPNKHRRLPGIFNLSLRMECPVAHRTELGSHPLIDATDSES